MGKTNIKKDDTQSYNVQKAPVLFENWLIYHIREKPILHVALSNKELSYQSSVVKATQKVCFFPLEIIIELIEALC